MRLSLPLAKLLCALALSCAVLVSDAQVSPGGAISGTPSNLSVRSLRVNTSASGCTQAGSLCIGTGSIANVYFGSNGTGWFANQDLSIGSNGTLSGNGRWDIRNGTAGEWVQFNADTGTNGWLNFRSNNVTVGKIGSSANLFADGAQNFGVIAGASKQLIFGSPVSVNVESNVFRVAPITGTSVSSALNNSAMMGEIWCQQSFIGGYRAFVAQDTLCATMVNASSIYLQVTQTGGTLDNVSLTAGQGPSDKLSLGGSKLDLTANNGDMNISAGGNILIAGQQMAFAVGSAGDFFVDTNPGRLATIQSDTTVFTSSTGAATAVVNVNGSAVCTQATGCPGGAARTWQNVAASRAFATDYTNSTGAEIMVNVAGQGNSSNAQQLLVDSVTVGSCSQNTSTGYCSMSAIVPNGSVYRVNGSTAAAMVWAELRP